MIKAIFFDVDGTLLSHTRKEVCASTRNALEQLRNKGIKLVLATGRHMLELKSLPIKDMEFDGYILLNGQLCLDAQGEVFWGNPMEGADKTALLQIFNQREIPLVLVEKDRNYINFINDTVRTAQIAISTPNPDIKEYSGDEFYQAVAYLRKEEEGILREMLPACKMTRWHDLGLDIGSAASGKVAGIEAFLAQNGILKEETMAFGDGENDIDMLKFAHVGVAMGNSHEEVKKSADYVTAHIDEDGVAHALKYFGLIESF